VSLADYSDRAKWDIVGALAFGARFCMLGHMGEHPFLHALPIVLRWSVTVACIPAWFKKVSWANKQNVSREGFFL
jgi:hypothetical protein